MPDARSADDDELESSEDHLYFLAIEKVFLEERGAPLTLSPKDWHVARQWHGAGIPLEWVERTLRELFENRRAKGTDDKIISLSYCRRSVEAAWKRHQKMQAPAVEAAPEIDVPARLEALARALPGDLSGRDAWVRRLLALEGDPERIEAELRELDREVLDAVAASLGPDARAAADQDLERALANLARRLGARQLEGAREQLREQILRDSLGLPVLSLFAPEAAA